MINRAPPQSAAPCREKKGTSLVQGKDGQVSRTSWLCGEEGGIWISMVLPKEGWIQLKVFCLVRLPFSYLLLETEVFLGAFLSSVSIGVVDCGLPQCQAWIYRDHSCDSLLSVCIVLESSS
jgi:hypothetical protein